MPQQEKDGAKLRTDDRGQKQVQDREQKSMQGKRTG